MWAMLAGVEQWLWQVLQLLCIFGDTGIPKNAYYFLCAKIAIYFVPKHQHKSKWQPKCLYLIHSTLVKL